MGLLVLCASTALQFGGEMGNVTVSTGTSYQATSFAILQDYNESSARYHLLVHTRASKSNAEQLYFAGFAEAYVTAELFSLYLGNLLEYGFYASAQFPPEWSAYASAYLRFLGTLGVLYNSSDVLCSQIAEFYYTGLRDGFRARGIDITLEQVFILNSLQDFYNLDWFFRQYQYIERQDLSVQRQQTAGAARSPELDDAWLFHNAWDDYYTAFPRIAKTYWFNLKLNASNRQNLSFPGVPAVISGYDLFLEVSTGARQSISTTFAVAGCDLLNRNATLLNQMDRAGNASVVSGIRLFTAALFAESAEHFFQLYSTRDGGTRDVELMLLDYVQISRVTNYGATLRERAAFVRENKILMAFYGVIIHQQCTVADATTDLLSNVFILATNEAANEQYYQLLNYTSHRTSGARYCVAARDLPRAVTYAEVRAFACYDDYELDPCLCGRPDYGIAARYDLLSDVPAAFGTVDARAVNTYQALNGIYEYAVGQPHGGPAQLPPFSYAAWRKGVPGGYYDVFPATWHETASFACVRSASCENDAICHYGSCICVGYWKGPHCEVCPYGFVADCSKCAQGFSISGDTCVYNGNTFAIALVVGIPAAVAVLAVFLWYMYYKQYHARALRGSVTESLLSDQESDDVPQK